MSWSAQGRPAAMRKVVLRAVRLIFAGPEAAEAGA
jgi:hypothetical protein